MTDHNRDARPADDHETHASTGGSAAAGAVTGGAVGAVAGGPVGAVVGAVGGAIVGALSERAMHGDDDHEHVPGDEAHSRGDHDHTGDDDGHDHEFHYDLGYGKGGSANTVGVVGEGQADPNHQHRWDGNSCACGAAR